MINRHIHRNGKAFQRRIVAFKELHADAQLEVLATLKHKAEVHSPGVAAGTLTTATAGFGVFLTLSLTMFNMMAAAAPDDAYQVTATVLTLLPLLLAFLGMLILLMWVGAALDKRRANAERWLYAYERVIKMNVHRKVPITAPRLRASRWHRS